jgi:broad specificity phosphatase PhoE
MLIYIRHGQSMGNVANLVATAEDDAKGSGTMEARLKCVANRCFVVHLCSHLAISGLTFALHWAASHRPARARDNSWDAGSVQSASIAKL